MVYSDHFSLYSLQSKENKIDETLLRIYFGNYKTLLTTRAGLHHRRVIFFRNVLIFLGSYPCSYSLLSTQTVSEPHSLEQSINLGGFFSLWQLNYTLPPNHSFKPSWENKTGSYSCFQLFANELVGRYHRLRCLFFRMLAHSRTVLMQQSLQIFLQPILFACQKLSKTIKRLEVASCSTIYGNSQLFNTGFLFLVPSTHGNNCCVYFHPEISKEFCLCLCSWPHPKKTYIRTALMPRRHLLSGSFQWTIAVLAISCWESLLFGSSKQPCTWSTHGHSSQFQNIPHNVRGFLNDFQRAIPMF